MKIGIVGFGHLGECLYNFILKEGEKHGLEIEFVWNRSPEKLSLVESDKILTSLEDISCCSPDLIVEVAHPNISKQYGATFLSIADYFIGSPTALADEAVKTELEKSAKQYKHGVYIPSGAFWGAQDIQKMAILGTLATLKVTMKKHPSAFRVLEPLESLNKSVKDQPVVLFEGSVGDLCPLAPNNVNTMAVAAIAAHNLGFNKVKGCLISDPSLGGWHIVEIEARGKVTDSGECFSVITTRKNPSSPGFVTGKATFCSFCASLLRARGQGVGIHMC
uniref:Aspartate dehydrogenase domain-containing protein n=1 Tax=Phallusia mammillata TaxID=59560 RepID=A0A6F9D767_9ASCI|nr:putative L-aspartate dehydrogenase [Phallusia mammillata]